LPPVGGAPDSFNAKCVEEIPMVTTKVRRWCPEPVERRAKTTRETWTPEKREAFGQRMAEIAVRRKRQRLRKLAELEDAVPAPS
jgi:hypothetical protein